MVIVPMPPTGPGASVPPQKICKFGSSVPVPARMPPERTLMVLALSSPLSTTVPELISTAVKPVKLGL